MDFDFWIIFFQIWIFVRDFLYCARQRKWDNNTSTDFWNSKIWNSENSAPNSTPYLFLTHSETSDHLHYTEGHIVYADYTDEVWESFETSGKIFTEETTGDSKEEEVSRRTRKILLNGILQCTLDATFWEKKPDGSMKCIGVCKKSIGKRIFQETSRRSRSQWTSFSNVQASTSCMCLRSR